jgi:thiamine pyrophosphokinase
MKKCIILANGKPPKKDVVLFLNKNGFNNLICADGGANYAKRLNLIPDYIIGDMDSISPEILEYYSGKSGILKIHRQDDTDIEKCLKFVIKKKCKECVLLGGTGNRLDHSFCNLGIILKFSDRIRIILISEKSMLTVEKGNVKLKTAMNETISVYAFNNKTFITSEGLKFPLRNDTLPFGTRESTSNISIGNEVNLHIKGGKVFLIRNFDTVRKNGLF